ncbi:hypothetical protein RBH29_10115 [Herbivorax sp. ANBcel31]|uniref:hypothetical protein n=1 Tax=Herbivorax sp. ANBcel31 TaxID=3069754 RepID=UPI0027B244F0|nr:hypothetical protein [Herbivorax sp. ANBcel31]MDQ2086781.1 hypothetical protein [Herbivorax sp. ANBcel31]
MFKLKKKKEKKQYKLVSPGDMVLAPCAHDVYRKAVVISYQEVNNNPTIRIKFKTGSINFVSAKLCYKIVKGIAVPLEKPKTKVQRFCLWFLRRFGLAEV